MRPLSSKKVAIIGAGPGGLAAAMLLGHAGADVTVYERHERIGGRSGAIEAEGFRFDVGPTFFLYPEILRSLFRQCGLDFDREATLERLDDHYDLHFEGGPKLRISRHLSRLKDEIAKISTQDAENVASFIDENRKKLSLFGPVLQRPFNSLRDVFRLDMLRALPLLRPHRSVDQDLGRYFKDPRTRLAFSFQSKYLGMSPYRCPSLFTILGFMEHEFGIYHPIGGTQAVMEAMAHAAKQFGVEFRFNTPIRRLHLEKKHARGVITDRGMEPADAVVVNADFARAMTKLVPNRARKRWRDSVIAQKQYSCSTFMLYLGLEGALPEQGHHTVFLSKDYEQNFAEIEDGRFLSESPSLYVQNAGVTDPTQAPVGHSTLYALMPVGHLKEKSLVWDESLTRQARTLVLARLKDAGFGDIEPRIRFEKIITPQNWEDDYDVHRGAVFNLAHNLGQMLHRRPHNRFEDIKGIYLVGGGTHPGSGLPVIFEGARISSNLLVQDLAPQKARERMPFFSFKRYPTHDIA
ncbi:phytoene desaturase family protein [Kozakia baliensis]|uniref:phytoene desaturase family protein n=1 Tax=Kozakia baliensis TaxID=153496 RepID=UPI001D048EEA|nr:phytoene desaturase family protein [Kozakia baliensis]